MNKKQKKRRERESVGKRRKIKVNKIRRLFYSSMQQKILDSIIGSLPHDPSILAHMSHCFLLPNYRSIGQWSF
jgi:hypothetical protein